jgi:hypothetical protein
MSDELERIQKEAAMTYSRYYPSICLEKLINKKNILSQDSRHFERDLNPGRPECKTTALQLE